MMEEKQGVSSEEDCRRGAVRLREPCEAASNNVAGVHHGFGFEATKRNNLHVLRDGFVLTTLGSAAVIIDRATQKKEYVFCPDDQGIGCVCVHPSKKFFAICGKGNRPNVYIYTFPSRRLHRVLKLGTEKAYSCASFSSDGTKLATVGNAPDFLLTVWDWLEEKIILRNKAFAQEIYNVSFAPQNDGFLTTSGVGHIRFWKMAGTFTGLKLQGAIGKFGKVELSDIAAYAELPDGKVLSGSESGSLLLWDGNFIKLEVRRPGGLLPHDGEVQVCQLIGLENPAHAQLLTAGSDGWLRWWSMEAIDSAETTDEDPFAEIKPLREVQLENVNPVSIVVEDGCLLIQDRNGSIFSMEEPLTSDGERQTIVGGHSGPITGVATSPLDHFAATCGRDKTVRLWDFVTRTMIYKETFNTAATSIRWASKEIDLSARTVLVGFEDGVVRVLYRGQDGWKLLDVFKPHNCPVTSITFSPDGSRLATTGTDGTVFFLEVVPKPGGFFKYTPIGFVRTPDSVCANQLCWFRTSDKVLVACNSAIVLEITIPHPNNNIQMPCTKATFELSEIPTRVFRFRRKPIKFAIPEKLTKKTTKINDEGQEVEVDEYAEERKLAEEAAAAQTEKLVSLPYGNVLSIMLRPNSESSFFLALDGPDGGPIYECSFGSEYPVQILANLPIDDGLNLDDENGLPGFLPGTSKYSPCSLITSSWSGKFIMNGGNDGSVRVRPIEAPDCYICFTNHDGVYGGVSGISLSFDDRFLLTTGRDGALFVQALKPDLVTSICLELFQKPGNRIKLKKAREMDPAQQEAENSNTGFLRTAPVVLNESTSSRLGFETIQPPLDSDDHDEVFESGIVLADDITDPNAYSIEDDKLKTEEDYKLKMANIEKDKVRKVIQQLRNDFERLLAENEHDAQETRLNRKEFNIDPELTRSLIQEGKDMLEEVVKETQWDVNQSKVRLDKLKEFFLDNVLVDSMSLRAFNNVYLVQSFRTPKFSETLKQALAALHSLVNNSDANGDKESSMAEGNNNNTETTVSSANRQSSEQQQQQQELQQQQQQQGVEEEAKQDGKNGQDNNNGGKSDKNKETHGGWEARKAGRKKRKAEMQTLLESKPDENADDPKDVAAINWVMKNMGDYKLKSAKDYQVPVDLQVNADKKQRQSILLAEAIQNLRMTFNKKYLALRELKRRIVENARTDYKRIQEINSELKLESEKIELPLVLDPTEWPEKRLEFNDEELDRFIQSDITESTPRVPESSEASSNEDEDASKRLRTPFDMFQQDILAKVSADVKSEYEQERWNVQRKLLLHEKVTILDRNIASVKAFDSAVYELRRERVHLEADLVQAELRQILFSKEQLFLNDFEKKDVALTKKLENCKAQKAEVVAEIMACQERLAAKKAEIEVWQAKDRIIMEEFNTIIGGDSNPFNAALLKIFKRKIKRTKQKNGDASDCSDSESDDDDDYDDEEEEYEDGEPEEERCPDGCDPTIYEKVLELREKRLDQEEVLSEFNKAIDELKKSNDRYQGREKQIDKELQATILEIQAFQNEKQRKLNEINVSVVLKLSQMACLIEPEGVEDETSNNDDDEDMEFLEEEFQEENEVDEDDPEIARLKHEIQTMLAQLETVEESGGDEDEIIEQQEQLLAKVQNLKLQVWRRRKEAIRVRERKSRLVLPSTIETSLIFDKNELVNLHAGIGKLIAENRAKKGEYRDLHHTQKRLIKEKRQKEADIAALQAKCDDLQMLKFGQLIDLDTIEKMGVSKNLTDLKAKFLDQEKDHRKEQSRLQNEIANAQEDLLNVTRMNSSLLQEIASLTEKQRQLEIELSGSSGPGGEGGSKSVSTGLQSQREAEETAKLTQLVNIQSKEIEALKREINLLSGSNPRVNQNQIIE